jgi:hypothetical protein
MEEKQYLMDEVRRDKRNYQFLSDEWRADLDIARASIEKFGLTLAFAPLWMKSDPEIALSAVKANGLAIEFIHLKLILTDVDICVLAVENNGHALELLPAEMRMNPDVLLAQLAHGYGLYSGFNDHVSETLLQDKTFMKRALAINGRLLELSPFRIHMDPSVAVIAARNCGCFAFKRLEKCFEIPEVIQELQKLQDACEAAMDDYIVEQDPKKKDQLYWEMIRYESDFGIRSIRSERMASSSYLDKETVPNQEPKGIQFFIMGDDYSMKMALTKEGQDPMKIDALFHSGNTGLGGFSYALAHTLQEKLHISAALQSVPLIDFSANESIQAQAQAIMKFILDMSRQQAWQRVRLTNFTYLKSSQFETFLGIVAEIQEQESSHALTIYLDIDPEFIKGKYGAELDSLIN